MDVDMAKKCSRRLEFDEEQVEEEDDDDEENENDAF